MPSALTYPGVYVEEIPSGVRTITGVSTSVAAFVDYFKRGLANKPVRIFNFGDFQREFGGLDTSSEASYGIEQFFRNGGSEAWVVRSVGAGAAAAAVTLLDAMSGATSMVLEAGRAARSNPGEWGNQLRVQIDSTANNRFNLTVLLVESQNGQEVVVESEKFINLTTSAGDSRNAQTVINDEASGSKLVRVTQLGGNRPLATGTVSGDLSAFPAITAPAPQVSVTISTDGTGTAQLSKVPTSLAEARRELESAIRQSRPELKAFSEATVSVVENRLRILAGPTAGNSQIVFSTAGTDPTASNLGLLPGEQRQGRMSADIAAVVLPLGADVVLDVTIGGVGPIPVTLTAATMVDLATLRTEFETKVRTADPSLEFAQARVMVHSDGAERRLILLAGTVGAAVTIAGAGAAALLLDAGNSTVISAHLSNNLTAAINVANNALVGITIGADGPHNARFAATANSLAAAATGLQAAIRAANTGATFTGARVVPYAFNGQSHLISIAATTNAVSFAAGPADGTTVTLLRLTSGTGATSNVQRYALGAGPAIVGTAHGGGAVGADALPDATALIGDLNAKTGIFALEEADLFNLLCIPRAAALAGDTNAAIVASGQALLSAAIAYCEKRRAFMLLDTPAGRDDPEDIMLWLEANASLRHRNAALFYPRVRIPDPLDEFRLRSFGASGTVAGLFARIDSTRGVWKAPAGTEAVVRNVSELEDVLTDQENGALNPLAINCLRNFPIFGHVVWGSRTLEGADQQASEWKYIPVRRVALFIEESLYRGLKWVVFEPNDEPLWAQVRLNVGAFMQNLFRQGAFQGSTPREAYFVKCDKETTTQNDINLGIVNILVGFAPLKPAEFVVIKLQQIAGQIAT
jgi:phage tail sheath protein FI